MSLDSLINKLKSDSFYYSDYEFVTNSQLGLIKKDVRTYKMMRDNPDLREETLPMIFGRAYHIAMLEPNDFNKKVKVCYGSTRATKVFKEFKKENKDCSTIILEKEYDKIMAMQDKLFQYSEIKSLLSLDGEREIANAWQDDDIGVYCKAKADYKNKNVLIDLKTTMDSSIQSFGVSCRKYGYDRQASFYLDGFNCNIFIFIVQEKEPPYNVSVFTAGKDFIEQGRDEYKYLLDVYRRYFIDNEESIDDFLIKGIL
jgi:hypothetical protein